MIVFKMRLGKNQINSHRIIISWLKKQTIKINSSLSKEDEVGLLGLQRFLKINRRRKEVGYWVGSQSIMNKKKQIVSIQI